MLCVHTQMTEMPISTKSFTAAAPCGVLRGNWNRTVLCCTCFWVHRHLTAGATSHNRPCTCSPAPS